MLIDFVGSMIEKHAPKGDESWKKAAEATYKEALEEAQKDTYLDKSAYKTSLSTEFQKIKKALGKKGISVEFPEEKKNS